MKCVNCGIEFSGAISGINSCVKCRLDQARKEQELNPEAFGSDLKARFCRKCGQPGGILENEICLSCRIKKSQVDAENGVGQVVEKIRRFGEDTINRRAVTVTEGTEALDTQPEIQGSRCVSCGQFSAILTTAKKCLGCSKVEAGKLAIKRMSGADPSPDASEIQAVPGAEIMVDAEQLADLSRAFEVKTEMSAEALEVEAPPEAKQKPVEQKTGRGRPRKN